MIYPLHTRLGISYAEGMNKNQGYHLKVGATKFYLQDIRGLSEKSVRKMMRELRERFSEIDDLMGVEGIRPRTIKRLLEGAVQEEEKRIKAIETRNE